MRGSLRRNKGISLVCQPTSLPACLPARPPARPRGQSSGGPPGPVSGVGPGWRALWVGPLGGWPATRAARRVAALPPGLFSVATFQFSLLPPSPAFFFSLPTCPAMWLYNNVIIFTSIISICIYYILIF